MKIQRILAIVMLLLGRDRVPAKELAQRFEVSLRTIYRDIQAINEAGIPICSQTGVGGGVGIMPEYKVEKRIFTSQDMLALLTALGFVQGAVPAGEIAPALAKLQSMLPEGVLPVGDTPLLFDASAWMGVDVSPLVAQLHHAMRERHCVRFCYLGQNHEESHRTVEPLRLLFKQNSWYLQGWCRTKQGLRLFKLARMWGVAILSEGYAPRPLPEIPDVYTRRMLEKTVNIRLRIQPQALDRLLEYLRAEELQPLGDGRFEADFAFVPDDFGYGLLLSFGTGCECLAPKWVREELAQRAVSIHRLYQ